MAAATTAISWKKVVHDLAQRHKNIKRIEPKSKDQLWRKNELIYKLHVDAEETYKRLLREKETVDDDTICSINQIHETLRLNYDKQMSFLSLILWIPRTVIFLWTIMLGGVSTILISPFRCTHPFLRKFCNVQNGSLPVDIFVQTWMRCICTSVGIQVTAETNNKKAVVQPTLLMFSHVSNLDVFCLVSSCPIYCKFIGKSILFLLPIFGWAAYALGTQPISRGNRKKAVQDLHTLQQKFQHWGRSLAISPEGTRSKTGLLARELKKGPFYLWQDCQHVPITPAVIFGAYELWPPNRFLPQPGQVVVRYCEPIRIETSSINNGSKRKDKNDDDDAAALLREKARGMTHAAMLKEFANPPSQPPVMSSFWFAIEYTILIIGLVVGTRSLKLVFGLLVGNHWSLAATFGTVVLIDLAMYVFVIH